MNGGKGFLLNFQRRMTGSHDAFVGSWNTRDERGGGRDTHYPKEDDGK